MVFAKTALMLLLFLPGHTLLHIDSALLATGKLKVCLLMDLLVCLWPRLAIASITCAATLSARTDSAMTTAVQTRHRSRKPMRSVKTTAARPLT